MKKFKFLIQLVSIPILIIVFNFLEYGFIWDTNEKFLYPIILTVISITSFYFSIIRRYFFIIAGCLLLLMVMFLLINQLTLSIWAGNFGFAVLLIVVFSYTIDFIKAGQITKL